MNDTPPAGFTLVESMVAVTILTLAVAGPLFTAGRAIVAAQTARDQLTASYLAQEGVEYVRALRDDEYLASYPDASAAWDDFYGSVDECHASETCKLGPIQGNDTRLRHCSGNGNGCTGTFSLLTNGTSYTRTIQIIDASPSGLTDVRVVATVSWSFHGTAYTVSTSNHLTPWQ